MADIEDLRAAIAGGRAIVIVGAGITIAATDGHPNSSWLGLVKSGVAFVKQHDLSSETWVEMVSAQVELAQSTSDADELLQAASRVGSRIRKMGDQAFADWIEGAVGTLPIEDKSWPLAILGLGSPVFTTNYDRIFEIVSGADSESWEDATGFQRILSASGAIGHLHGIYTRPSSVILSEADYQRLLLSSPSQDLQKAISSSRSVVYIGCGGTLEDPNFSNLLEWHRSTFAVSGVKHFRLCRTPDLAALRETHRNDNITPIAYGDAFNDLPPFLESVAPGDHVAKSSTGIVRDAIGEAREFLVDQLRAETIVGEGLLDLDERSLSDLTVAPVILPVPHSEYLELGRAGGRKPERIDGAAEVQTDGVLLLVSEENGGLSTAIRWLLCIASDHRTRAAPIYLDFRRFPKGVGPLDSQARVEAFHRGLVKAKRDDLPPLVIGVDNFHGHSKSSVRLAEDLKKLPGLVVLGAHANFESESLAILQEAGIEVRVRYLGKLGAKDVKAMATLASPGRAETLASSVISTLRSEHLPRTPFTVALLVAIMMRGEALVANASPTTILEQYVSHLLGRDEADQDPRFTLTSTDRESILTDLATLFVEANQGSMLQSDVVESMEAFFERFGWSESPTEVLSDLVRRRVLQFDSSQVRFTQSSFLHLFAAKAVAKKATLRGILLERPLYYSPVLRAYASLIRHDSQLLRDLEHLVDDTMALDSASSLFALEAPVEAPANLEEALSSDFPEATQPSTATGAIDDDPFDSTEDRDVLPFPLTTDEDLSTIARYAQSVDLLSAVLRDSEEVDDLQLKTSILARVLRGWGHLTDAFVEDEGFKELTRTLSSSAIEQIEDPEAEEAVLEFVKLLPAVVVWSGISMSLASRKLIVILQRAIADHGVSDEARSAIPASLLVYSIHEPGWEKQMGDLIDGHENTWIVREFITYILWLAFEEAKANSEEERRLRSMLVHTYLARFKFNDERHRNLVATAYEGRINKMKLTGARLTTDEVESAE